jgi:signal transduction histidine kinase
MLPHLWRFALRIIRTLLAVGALSLLILRDAPGWEDACAAAYLLFAGTALISRRFELPPFSLYALLADSLFCLFWMSMAGTVPELLLATILIAFVLGSTVLLHDLLRVAVVFSCLGIWSYAPDPPGNERLRAVVIAGGLVASIGAVQKRHLEDRIAMAARQNVLYRYESQQAREAERERIAHDFHDGPLQHFVSFGMRLQVIRKLFEKDPEAARAELQQLQAVCREQVQELRTFVRTMRPLEEGASLSSSLSRMVEQFQKDTGIIAVFTSGDLADPAQTEVSLEVLHIVRESLNNVQKHSGASRAAISLSRQEHQLEIGVEDNGTGYPFAGEFNLDEMEMLRLGPGSIKRRVRLLNGEMIVDSRPGQGASMRIRVPL